MKDISISLWKIILVMILIALIIVTVCMFRGTKDTKTSSILDDETIAELEDDDIKRYNEAFYENGWNKNLVSEITEEEIPIPAGFEYVEGNKKTGLVIQDKDNKLIWIPYNENTNISNIDEKYFSCDYDEIDYTSYDHMKKYGGFYVKLSDKPILNNIVNMNNEEYDKQKEEAEELYYGREKIKSHLAYKEELEQILNFSNNGEIELSTGEKMYETATIVNIETMARLSGKYEEGNNENNQEVSLKHMSNDTGEQTNNINYDENNINIYKTKVLIKTPSGKQLKVPVPVGYNVEVKNNIATITDQANPDLAFVWIPVNEEYNNLINDELKNKLCNLIQEQSQKDAIMNSKDPQTEEYQYVLDSINMYGGFYMGIAEYGFDKDGCEYNLPRGMKNDYVVNGDYFRSVPIQTQQENNKSNYPNEFTKLEDGSVVLTYENAKKVAEECMSDSNTVRSHLTYGIEWNAAMMYLVQANALSGDNTNQVMNNSTSVQGAKYINSNYTDTISQLDTVAGLWGIAGNLSDITQEVYTNNGESYHIARGGNYGTTGQEASMASMQFITDEDLKNSQYGFRTCLVMPTTNNKQDYKETGNNEFVSSLVRKSNTNTGFFQKSAWIDWKNEGRARANEGFIYVADTIHNYFRLNGYTYNSDVLKNVPGTAANNPDAPYCTDCSHFVSWALYCYKWDDYCAGTQLTTADLAWNPLGLKDCSGNYNLQVGDIVLTTSSHVQIYNGKGTWQNCGTNNAIKCILPYYKEYSWYYEVFRVNQSSPRKNNIYDYMNREFGGDCTRTGFAKYYGE